MPLYNIRRQLPVGQGFFHIGSIILDQHSFHYVYDCGSENTEALHHVIDFYVDELADIPIDTLFISHLDADHVCGLDRLLPSAQTRCIVLPYLSPLARLIMIAEAVHSGAINGAHLALLCDPTTWFTDRGVDRVIYVTPGQAPPNEPPIWTGIDPNGPPLFPSRREHKVPLKAGAISLDVDSLDDDDDEAIAHPKSKNATTVVSCMQPIRFQPMPDCTLNWQFVVFVHPEGERENSFRRAVRSMFGRSLIPGKKFEINRRALQELLQNSDERAKLASCYELIRKNRNLTSLSLYSGPVDSDGVFIDGWSTHWRVPCDKAGWLGTGDSNLSVANRRLAFLRHFDSLAPMINTVALPHHGSRHNFHQDLLEIGDLFVVAAGARNRHGHPHPEVVARVGPRLFTTSEDAATELVEWVRMT